MHSRRSHLTYALGTLVIGASLVLTAPVGAENSLTTDLSTQPNLKSWSNIIPNVNRRFVVLADFSNQAVLDRETGLVWERSPDTTDNTWEGARDTCIDKNVGGRKGWRLPAIPELTSFIDPSVSPGPTLPLGHPFLNVPVSFYWTATTDALHPTSAWIVNFVRGNVGLLNKADHGQLWCVRGGMNADQY